jgi:hypothetical protein
LTAVAFAALIGFGRLPSPSAKGEGPKSFSAQQFILVDSSGNTLATLGSGKNGGAVLTFFDLHGKRIMGVGALDENTGEVLAVYDGNTIFRGNGILRAEYGGGADGFGGSVIGPEGNLRIVMASNPDGTAPGYVVYDANGTPRTFSGITSDPRNVGHFVLDATAAARTGVFTSEPTLLNFNGLFANDANGTNRVAVFEALDGSSAFSGLSDAAGTNEAFDFVLGDGSFSESLILGSNGFARVQDFQAGPIQGVATFDSTGTAIPGTSPDGFLP